MRAGRTVVLAVAGVVDRVVAGVTAGARLATFGRPRAAGDRRVDDLGPAGAGQLLETDSWAGLAVATVTKVFTSRKLIV